MQVVESIASVQFLKHSVYRVESWSADYYSVSVVFSLVLTCQWGSESIAFSVCSVQGVYCSVGHSPSVLFSVCSVQSTGCSPRVCHVQSPHSEGPLPLQFLNFNIPSTTEGHLRAKYNIKIKYKKSTYLSTHNDTRFGTHWGNLLVSSRFSTGDHNLCIHSIPLWEPCVEKRVMLRASVHRPVGEAL